MALIQPTVADMVQFVSVYQPNAKLRDKHGLDVRVGRHIAPRGGPEIKDALVDILYSAHNLNSYSTHLSYETLHPFTDGNGRSGRMLWAWQVRDLRLGFLHKFYYQTLDARR